MARYQTLVASFATPLHEFEENTANATIASMCFRPDYPHTSKMLEHMYNGLAVKIHKVYNYGRDHYTLGLPDGYGIYLDNTDTQDVIDAIESDVGYTIDLIDEVLDNPRADYIHQWWAIEEWGYNPITGRFDNAPIGGINQPAEMIGAEFGPDGDMEVRFYLGKRDIGGGIPPRDIYGTVIVTQAEHGFDMDALYYHAAYVKDGDRVDFPSYWFYEKGTGEHPALDVDDTEIEFGSPFLPVVPLREDNQSLGPECEDGEFVRDQDGNKIVPDTDLYRTSVQLCKRADTDFDELTRSISNNPDIDQIDHAYLIFGVDIRTERKTSLEYLHQFFDELALTTTGASSIEVKDAKYRIKLSFDDAIRTQVSGDLGQDVKVTYNGNNMTLERKVDDNNYVRIEMVNLLHTNYVSGNHTVTTSLVDSGEEDNYNFIVPLRYSLVKQDRSFFDQEDLLKESFKIVFNAVERKKLKWYQSGFFKFLLTAITIVVSVISVGAGLAALTAAVSAGPGAVALFAAEILLYGQLASITFRFLAEIFDPLILAVLGAVAFAVAVFAPTAVNTIADFSAEKLLQISTGLSDASSQSIENELEDLVEEISEFEEEAKELEDELALMEEELENNPAFDVNKTLKMEPLFIPNEAPTNYYNRTIHAGNVGVQVLNVIESYVDSKLQLPEYKQRG